MSKNQCRICGSSDNRKLFTSLNVHGRHLLGNEKFDIYECYHCHVLFTDVIPNYQYYRKYYPKNYYETIPNNGLAQLVLSWFNNLGFARRMAIINRFKPTGKNVLDIGCANGEFLNQLPANFERYGVEVNTDAYLYIKKNYPDITVYNQKIDSTKFKNNIRFDIIVMWHVLEHVDNPNIFFKSIRKILNKNGVLIIEIPNRDSLGLNIARSSWFHLDTPRHLFFYNYICLKELLRKNHLRIINYSSDPLSYFHDLSFSLYNMPKQNNLFIDFILFIIIVPITLLIRLILSLFYPRAAEINTYVIKHS